MSQQIPTSSDPDIGGDTLALDPAIRKRINNEAKKLRQKYPGKPLSLRVEISEQFDQLHGHRVLCALSASLDGRRKVMIREASKDAFDSISKVFSAAKRQLRRLGVVAGGPQASPPTKLRHTGT